MKKTIILAITLAAVTVGKAQIAEVSSPQPLLKGVQSNMFNPVLSADGTQLLFSGADYADARVYDFNDNVTRRLSLAPEQTFKAHFDASNAVVTTPTSVRTEGTKLFITTKGVERSYSPVSCYAGYCWASLSPDGSKVMFVAAGKGVYVVDLKGNIIANPGDYTAPAWYGNDHIVAQLSKDDGHQYQSSQILLMTLDGKTVQPLTRPESMAMDPTASAKAGKIVYSTIDGRLYQINVTLNK